MSRTPLRAPIHPYWILLSAILLPGSGHVLAGAPQRGLTMQLFMISLGWITWHVTSSQQSLAGRLAGGLFIYAMSILDAYRIARLRWAAYHRAPPAAANGGRGRTGRDRAQGAQTSR
jgi:hypothetical protein